MLNNLRHLDFKHWNRDKRLLLEVKLPSRLKLGNHTPGTLPAWTESIGRHLAVVHSRASIGSLGAIRKNDEIALEIDLPERRPFSARYILCEGRVGFVTLLIDDRIRLGMIVDRMHFRAARTNAVEQPASFASARSSCGRGSGI
jgi:hypothetical protein